MSLAARAQEAGLAAGWWLGPRVPRWAQRAVWEGAAGPLVRVRLATPGAWAGNVERILGRPPTGPETSAAVGSYLRYYLEMLSLPGWSGAEIDGRVLMPRLSELQADVWAEGCVVALPHLGNWDLAGAFSCRHGMPVATVAEELPGAAYQRFLDYRRGLGMRVYGHRDPGALAALVADARAHRLVCLVADRDLRGQGVPVRWRTRTGSVGVTLPAGPLLVARRSGAHLRALWTFFAGDAMVIDLGDRIPVGPGRAGLVEAAQAIADQFAAQVLAHPADWHLFQPFFPA